MFVEPLLYFAAFEGFEDLIKLRICFEPEIRSPWDPFHPRIRA